MKKENFNITNFCNWVYANLFPHMNCDVKCCELQYQRDRASFAGIVLKVTDNKNVIEIRECQEKMVQDINKPELFMEQYLTRKPHHES